MTRTLGYVTDLVVLLVTLYATWLVVRGPFFGRPLPPMELLPVAGTVAIAGVVVLSIRAVGSDATEGSSERPFLDESTGRTYDR